MLIHTRDNEYHPRLTAWGCSAVAQEQGGFGSLYCTVQVVMIGIGKPRRKQ